MGSTKRYLSGLIQFYKTTPNSANIFDCDNYLSFTLYSTNDSYCRMNTLNFRDIYDNHIITSGIKN